MSRGDQAEEIVLTVFRSGAGLQLVELIVSVTDMSVCVDVCHQTLFKSLFLLQFFVLIRMKLGTHKFQNFNVKIFGNFFKILYLEAAELCRPTSR